MTTRRPESDVRLDVEAGRASPTPRPLESTSFHVALLGDFSGRRGGGAGTGEALKPVRVDRDVVDTVMAGMDPGVRVGGGAAGVGVEVRFRTLEDFHPDELVERVPLFAAIREVASAGSRPTPRRERSTGERAAPVEDMLSGSVLDRIVDASDAGDAGDASAAAEGGGGERGGGDPLRAWVDDIVRPHLEAAPDPDQARLASDVDRLVADGMRELLQSADFRRLEALWRGVDFLVRRIETDSRLTLHLVDVGRDTLAADPETFSDLLGAGAGPEGEPWSVVAALWNVGPDPDDLILLRTLARHAAAAGAVLLAGGEPTVAGLPSLAQAGERAAYGEPDPLWAAFRREPEARAVGLAIPRFLLRLPYGEDADPCERVALEEIPGTPTTSDYVWGAAALPVVLILARAFTRAGPELLGAVDPEVDRLPLHVHGSGVDAVATPCTEVALTRDDADRLMEAGLMPLAWSRGSDAIRLARLQSVADPLTGLDGWWRG